MLLKKHFHIRLISKNGDLRWLPKYPDHSVPDFFLWDYIKDRVYMNKPQRQYLERIKEISQKTQRKVMAAILQRASAM